MYALAIELTLVVAWFIWAYRRQERDRAQANRPPPDQLPLPLESDREVGS
jgi:hypothetical protein